MTNAISALMFVILFATFVFAQTEEPDWTNLGTHVLASHEKTFSQEVATAVVNAVLYGNKASGDGRIKVTNFVEFCNPYEESKCFAVAVYSVGPDMNGSQYLVWLLKTSATPTYFKLWERQAGGGVCCYGASIALVWPFHDIQKSGWLSPCVYVATSSGGAGQSVEMRLYCVKPDSYSPEVLWEYTGDYWGESTAQAFRKSTVTFRDIDNDQINELILDTVEGYRPEWENGDQTFKITKQCTLFRYQNERFVAITPVPDS